MTFGSNNRSRRMRIGIKSMFTAEDNPSCGRCLYFFWGRRTIFTVSQLQEWIQLSFFLKEQNVQSKPNGEVKCQTRVDTRQRVERTMSSLSEPDRVEKKPHFSYMMPRRSALKPKKSTIFPLSTSIRMDIITAMGMLLFTTVKKSSLPSPTVTTKN